MAHDFVNDRLRLVEEPDREADPVLGQVGTPESACHSCTEAKVYLRGERAELPQVQAVSEVHLEPRGVLLWDIGLSWATGWHRRSIASRPPATGTPNLTLQTFNFTPPPVPETGRSVLSGGHEAVQPGLAAVCKRALFLQRPRVDGADQDRAGKAKKETQS